MRMGKVWKKEAPPDPARITALLGDPAPGACVLEGASGPPFLPESFTPDHKPLMGEVPELRGFYLGCGFNSAGECEGHRHAPPNSPRQSGGGSWWGGGAEEACREG